MNLSNYLIHWIAKRDAKERENHKYIARIWHKSSWRYFYDASALAAFQRKKEKRGETVDVQYADGQGGFRAARSQNKDLDRHLTSAHHKARQAVTAGKNAADQVLTQLGLKGISKDPSTLREQRDADTAARLAKYKKRIAAVEKAKAEKAAELEARRAARAAEKKSKPVLPEEEEKSKKGSSGGSGGGGKGSGGKGSGGKGSGASAKNPNAVGALANLPLKDRTYTADEDMRAVNPNRGKGKEYEQNDVNCALAYDMRRRGFDVRAKGSDEPGGPEKFSEWYKDCKFTEIEQDDKAKGDYGTHAVSKLLSDLGQQPNGSYGMVYISWADGGGRAVTWAIEDNKLVFRDCQSGKTLDLKSMAGDISFLQYARTDNLKLTDKAIEAVESAKQNEAATKDKSVVQSSTDKDDKDKKDDKKSKETKTSKTSKTAKSKK